MKKLIIPIIACLMFLTSCGMTDNGDITGSWDYDGSTYDYRDDGNVYRNGTKLWRYEARDDGSLRVYDGKNGNDYNDYTYSVADDSMTLNGQTYNRAQ